MAGNTCIRWTHHQHLHLIFIHKMLLKSLLLKFRKLHKLKVDMAVGKIGCTVTAFLRQPVLCTAAPPSGIQSNPAIVMPKASPAYVPTKHLQSTFLGDL